MITTSLLPRDLDFHRLKMFVDQDSVKVVTGIRRCGKSSLLKLMAQYLSSHGVPDNQILQMNFESMQYSSMTYEELYRFVASRMLPGKRLYLFLDEIQRVDRWEDAVNSFRVDFDCDIYITGSNSKLLSSEFSNLLSGRYVQIRMLPLSFSEFLEFNGYTVKQSKDAFGRNRFQVFNKQTDSCSMDELMRLYFRIGGMPVLAGYGFDSERIRILLDGIYSTVLLRDIIDRGKANGMSMVTDVELLRKISGFLADNIGNPVSMSSIGNMLVSQKEIEQCSHKAVPADKTVKSYVDALVQAYVFYEAKRYDIKGKEYLKTLGKYYIVDPGLRGYLIGFDEKDTGRLMENIVFLELYRRGYEIGVGKIGNLEIDFSARKDDEKLFLQVCQSMDDSDTAEREVRPFKKLENGYEKLIITLHEPMADQYEGYPIISLASWLLG